VPQQETSEGLLQLPIIQQLQQGQKMLVLRGQGGRNLVKENLQQQGVKVDYIDLYQRQMPVNSQQLWQQQKNLPNLAVITSGEILQSWQQLLGEIFKQIPVVVISVRLAKLAQQLGFQQIIIAHSTRSEDIITAIQDWQKQATRDISEQPY
jgi:uroporphyrinogen-III synthase